MKIKIKRPPRVFQAGENVKIKDCAEIKLNADEQVTFVTERAAEYDLVRKSWGFYATPSLNGRLKKFGLHAVLVKNSKDQFYVMIVEKGSEPQFQNYLRMENQKIVAWLHNDQDLENLQRKIQKG